MRHSAKLRLKVQTIAHTHQEVTSHAKRTREFQDLSHFFRALRAAGDLSGTPSDPWGIHKAIWDEFQEEDCELPPDKPLVLAAYDAGPRVAYVDSIAVGDVLPAMPLFLEPEFYVPAPLEATYQTTWNAFPAVLKGLLEGPPATPPA